MAIKCSVEHIGYEYRIQEDFGSEGQRTVYASSFDRQKVRRYFEYLRRTQSDRKLAFQVRPLSGWETLERS